jgi:prophage regulatory protein
MAEILDQVREALLSRQDLERTLRIGKTAVFERLNPRSRRFDPDFPRPIELGGPNSKRWVKSEVEEYIDRKIEASRAGGNHG